MITDKRIADIKASCILSIAEYGNQDAKDILALIERMEESEKLIPPEALEDCGELGCEDCQVYRPWRTAAGLGWYECDQDHCGHPACNERRKKDDAEHKAAGK